MPAPTATIFVQNPAIGIGQSPTPIYFQFSEAVTGFTNADITVPNGTLTGVSSTDGGVTWRGDFTPTAGTTDDTNVFTVDLTGVASATDATPGVGTATSSNFVIDLVAPSVAISIDDTTLTVGQTATVTFTFSEPVVGFSNASIAVDSAHLTPVATSDGGLTYTATLIPNPETHAPGHVTVSSGYFDQVGNTHSGFTQAAYTIDTLRPTVSIDIDDTQVSIGDHPTVTFTFNTAIDHFDASDLVSAAGSFTPPQPTFNGGGFVWTSTFLPFNGQELSNVTLSLNTALVQAVSSGNTGITQATSNAFSIDTRPPTVSVAVADSALAAGQTSLVTFTFSEAVTGFTNADTFVDHGTLSPVGSADGGRTWTATFTPDGFGDHTGEKITAFLSNAVDLAGNHGSGQADSNPYDIDLTAPTASIAIADAALKLGQTSLVTVTFSEAVTGFTNADLTVPNGTLGAVSSGDGGVTWTATYTPGAGVTDATNLVTLDRTGVTDIAGNPGVGTASTANFTIDTVRPTATLALSDTALAVGQTAGLTITFSEAVTGFTNADLSVPNGSLSAVTSSDGGVTWTAAYTPLPALNVASNTISLDLTGVADAAGNAGTGTAASPNFALDSTAPTGSIALSTTSLTGDGDATVTLTFSEPMGHVAATAQNAALGTFVSQDGGLTWRASLNPTGEVSDDTNVVTLVDAATYDLAGNPVTGVIHSVNYVVDTTAPDPHPLPVPPLPPPSQPAPPSGPVTLPGSAGDDHIDGGPEPNRVAGGDGADSISGEGGDDSLSGDGGADQLQGNTGSDTLMGGAGADTVHGGQDADFVQGGADNDLVFGDRGDDTVRGGQGDDQVFGGDGNDFLSGDRGADTLTGGAGADIFHTFAGAGLDRVTDFSLAEGDRVMIDAGATYALAQVGADTVISLSDGAQMILAGVQLSSLSGAWIFTG